MLPTRTAARARCLAALAAVALAASAGCGDGAERSPPPEGAPARWERVEPGGRTRTARGAPYAFWVRRGDPARLLLFFQGGGGCFSYETCRPGSGWFDDAVEGGDDPSGQGGILDRSEPDNPFRDHTVVFIPSATGDVHWGDARRTYRSGSEEVQVEHRGFVNAMAAVRWAFRHLRAPRSVFVTGCSAGSVGSAAFAPYVLEHWPDADVRQLGDSLAFVFPEPVDLSATGVYENMPRWIPAVRALRPGEHTMADYYLAIARHYPRATFAQFNHAEDDVQRAFYEAAGGDPAGFGRDLRASVDAIDRGAPNFHRFTAPGHGHCVLPSTRFFTERHHGTAVRDWVTAVATGRDAGDVP